MDENKRTIFENNIGAILSTLAVSFIVGTLAMIYTNNKNTEVFREKFFNLTVAMGEVKLGAKESMTELKNHIVRLEAKMSASTKDRWTKSDQHAHEAKIESKITSRFELLENRILRNESHIFDNPKKKP